MSLSAEQAASNGTAPPRQDCDPDTPTPKVKFDPVRACAGGVDDHTGDDQHRAHTRQIELTATVNGDPAPNTSFTLVFEGNQGHDYGDGREKRMARLHKLDQASQTTEPSDPGGDEEGGGGTITVGGGGGPLTPTGNEEGGGGIVTPGGDLGPGTPGGPDTESGGGDFEPFDAAHPWTETLDVTTDANGKVKVWVLSSDVICQPRLLARWKNDAGDMIEVGSVSCDFAPSVSLRRFGLKKRVDPVDTGWIFDDELLASAGEAPNKVYLKFQADPSITKDSNYFWAKGSASASPVAKPTLDADGDGAISEEEAEYGTVRRPLNDDLTASGKSNWSFVNGHKVRIKIVEIVPQDDGEVDDINDYATIIDASGNAVNSIELTTSADGSTSFNVQAGPSVEDAQDIIFEIEDLTEHTE